MCQGPKKKAIKYKCRKSLAYLPSYFIDLLVFLILSEQRTALASANPVAYK